MKKYEGKKLLIGCAYKGDLGEVHLSPGENIWCEGGQGSGLVYEHPESLIRDGWEID
jgi:hypothetical protein